MFLEFCKSKIHRATVTGAVLDYEGSVALDPELIESGGFYEGQAVLINNVNTGVSWKTYIIKGEPNSGDVILNGPPARLFQKGDIVIILAYVFINMREVKEIKSVHPTVVLVDKKNQVIRIQKGNI